MTKKNDGSKVSLASRLAQGHRTQWEVSDATNALTPPVYLNSTFAFRSLDDADEIMSRGGRTFELGEDYVYSRGGNPTERELEHLLAIIEGGEDSVVYSTGMAAIAAAVRAIGKRGDHVLVSRPCYGETHWVFAIEAERNNMQLDFVDTSSWDEFVSSVRDDTRMLFIETPSNPTLAITDLERVAAFCRERGITTIIDNTFATGCLQQPLAYGCDVVVQSLSKYISGHGDITGGAVVCNDRDILKALREDLFIYGASLKPFDAFLVLRGLRTLPLRVLRHSATALKVAQFLEGHPGIRRVLYPGLPSFSGHEQAAKQMSAFGGILAFELATEASEVERFINALELCWLAPSFGTPKTLVQVPARITHRSIPAGEKQVMGISLELIRLAVGLEDPEDLIADLERALAQVDNKNQSGSAKTFLPGRRNYRSS